MSMTPPPMQAPGEPPRKSGPSVWLIVILAVGGVCCVGGVVLAAILFPVFAQARQAALTTNCMSHMKLIGTGFAMYNADHDDRMPEAAHWMDSLSPYHVTDEYLHCPAATRDDPSAYGYAYDSRMSRKNVLEILDNIQTMPVAFDSSITTRNASSDFSTLPTPGRHYRGNRGNNVLYLDYHVGLVPDGQR
jgi:hypothetical protein